MSNRFSTWQACLQRDVSATLDRAGLVLPFELGNAHGPGLHLAVFVEPYLTWILEGRKTIESRFSRCRAAPYQAISADDLILLKRAAGPIIGLCRAAAAEFHCLNPATFRRLKASYSAALCAHDPNFWAERSRARFATLVHLTDIHRLPPIACSKKDRRGWVRLSS